MYKLLVKFIILRSNKIRVYEQCEYLLSFRATNKKEFTISEDKNEQKTNYKVKIEKLGKNSKKQ